MKIIIQTRHVNINQRIIKANSNIGYYYWLYLVIRNAKLLFLHKKNVVTLQILFVCAFIMIRVSSRVCYQHSLCYRMMIRLLRPLRSAVEPRLSKRRLNGLSCYKENVALSYLKRLGFLTITEPAVSFLLYFLFNL